MKKEKIQKKQDTLRWAVAPGALALACLALAGCGGGGGSASISALSGSVIDGYIEGAEVCLDLDNNQTCDAGEPKATTGKDGSYKLDTTGLAASQIKAAHLLTTVPLTAKDADDGGQTLAQAGKSAFSLLAPAAAYVKADGAAVTGAVISPLTTLVSHEMITSKTPLATAQTYVRARLSLADSTDLTQDFVAKKDTDLSSKAQMLTAAIGEVKATAMTAGASDKEALFAALQYLQTQVADLQSAVTAAKNASTSVKPVDWVKTAIATDAAKPVVADLLAEAKKTTDSSAVSSAVALIEQGIYGGDHVLENCLATSASCTPTYWKVQGSGGKITLDNDYVLTTTGWTKSSNSDWVLTSAGWKKQNACASDQSATYSVGSDGVTTVTFCAGNTERVVARMVDAAGKTLSALGLNPPTAYASTTLPAGSQLYWLEFANTEDKYYLYPDGDAGYWDGSKQVSFTSLDAFIQNRTGSNYLTWNGLRFSFVAGGTSTGGNLTLLQTAATSPTIATYTRRTVGSQEVLIINAQAPGNNKGDLIIFAEKDGVVYGGTYRSAAVRQQSEPKFNKTMMNAILTAGKLPTVLD